MTAILIVTSLVLSAVGFFFTREKQPKKAKVLVKK